MEKVTGYVTGVNGNLVSARFSGSVRKNEVGFVKIGNDRLKGEVIRACKNLKFIDVAFTGVDHVDLEAAKEMGVKVSNASGHDVSRAISAVERHSSSIRWTIRLILE